MTGVQKIDIDSIVSSLISIKTKRDLISETPPQDSKLPIVNQTFSLPVLSVLQEATPPETPQTIPTATSSSDLAPLPKITIATTQKQTRPERITTLEELDKWLGLNQPKKKPTLIKPSTTEKSKTGLFLNIVPVITQEWSVSQIAEKCCPAGWEELFTKCLPEFTHIDQILNTEYRNKGKSIYPLMKDIFRVYTLCRPEKVRVIIMGQDPYPRTTAIGTPVANGVSFSSSKEAGIQRSLKNIYKELCFEYDGKTAVGCPKFTYPSHGDLTQWVQQGVFLLNRCLTLNAGEASSHKTLWDNFVKETLAYLTSKNKNIIFVMWGKKSTNFVRKYVRNCPNKLESAHPSPLSAYSGFFGCGHFKEVNKILKEQGQKPINWQIT